MTKENKDILLKYLCMALPYDCMVTIAEGGIDGLQWDNVTLNSYLLYQIEEEDGLEYIKPYLRPMSSMTEEESNELESITFPLMEKDWDGNENPACIRWIDIPKYMDFILSHHFDYQGLIEKGLALEAPGGMYVKLH